LLEREELELNDSRRTGQTRASAAGALDRLPARGEQAVNRVGVLGHPAAKGFRVVPEPFAPSQSEHGTRARLTERQ